MLLAGVVLMVICTCHARVINVTIDDTLGDERTMARPRYALGWSQYSRDDFSGAPHPSDQLAPYNKTLHCSWVDMDTPESPLRGSFKFNGTAVYVFIATKWDVTVKMTFSLDDQNLGSPVLSSPRNGSPGYLSDQLAFSADQLAPEEHKLDFVLNSGVGHEWACFNYAVYTTDDGTQSEPEALSGVPATGGTSIPGGDNGRDRSQAKPPRGVLIAVILIGGILLAAACTWCIVRRRRRRPARF